MREESSGITSPIEIDIQNGIILRQLVSEDAAAVFALIEYDRSHLSQNSDVTARTFPTLESVIDNVTNVPGNTLQFGVWVNEVLVGRRDLEIFDDDRGEMKGWIGKEHTGHGYAARSIEALADYSFSQMELDQLVSNVMMTNIANLKTLAKIGFIPSGMPFKYDEVEIQEFVLNNPARVERLAA